MLRYTAYDRVFDTVVYIFMSIVLLIVLYPLMFIVFASLSDPLAVMAGKVWIFPVKPNLEAYRMVMRDDDIWTGYLNTILYVVGGTSLNLVMTVAAAYPLSKRNLFGRSFVMKMMVFTMYFSGGLIPTYILIHNLNMINTYWVMIVPGAVGVWNIVITRTYFMSNIPVELEESAYIDGASPIYTLMKIVLPLSKPILAVMVLFYSVGHWNEFFKGLIYLTDSSKFPLQLILRRILIQNKRSEDMLLGVDDTFSRTILGETIKYALIIVSSLPVLCLYPFLQKYFVKGVMIGSIKG